MPRGGKRQGQPGRSYGNRTDMQQGPRQAPIMRPPSERYGQQAELVRSQQALPVQTQSGPAAPRPVAPPAPTQLVPLTAPTARPNEPLTAGAPVGPGPGPMPPTDPYANPQLPAELMQSLEMLATLPNASDATRNLVRRLRSRL